MRKSESPTRSLICCGAFLFFLTSSLAVPAGPDLGTPPSCPQLFEQVALAKGLPSPSEIEKKLLRAGYDKKIVAQMMKHRPDMVSRIIEAMKDTRRSPLYPFPIRPSRPMTLYRAVALKDLAEFSTNAKTNAQAAGSLFAAHKDEFSDAVSFALANFHVGRQELGGNRPVVVVIEMQLPVFLRQAGNADYFAADPNVVSDLQPFIRRVGIVRGQRRSFGVKDIQWHEWLGDIKSSLEQ